MCMQAHMCYNVHMEERREVVEVRSRVQSVGPGIEPRSSGLQGAITC